MQLLDRRRVRWAATTPTVRGLHRQDATGSLPGWPDPAPRPAGRGSPTSGWRRPYPGSARTLCALDHPTPFQLLVATILSAQCTDARVNLTTPALFARYPDAASLAVADLADVEELIRSTGFFRAKARNLVGMAEAVAEPIRR